MTKNSIGFKVLQAYIAGVVLSVILLITVIFFLFFYAEAKIANYEVSMVAKRHAHNLRYNASDVPEAFLGDEVYATWIYENLNSLVAFRVLNDSGVNVFNSEVKDGFWVSYENLSISQKFTTSFTFENEIFYTATERFYRNGKEYFFQVAISKELYVFVNKCFAIPRVFAGVLLFSIILFFVFVVCSGKAIKWAMLPLLKISDSSTNISPVSIHERLSVNNIPVEVAPLVSSFNKVLDRVEGGFRAQQEFLTKVAHELKTPLALIRAQIESSELGSYNKTLLNDVDHMARQVQQLIMLAEVCEVQNYNCIKIEVENLVYDVFKFLSPIAESLQIELSLVKEYNLEWNVDKAAFFILLKNLVENALQHSPPGASVVVNIKNDTLSVRDYGPGISNDNVIHIFERFWRGPERRDVGAGLGLAICKEIAQVHDFEITIEHESPGVSFLLKKRLSK